MGERKETILKQFLLFWSKKGKENKEFGKKTFYFFTLKTLLLVLDKNERKVKSYFYCLLFFSILALKLGRIVGKARSKRPCECLGEYFGMFTESLV